jgi:acyl dehydratase
MSIAYWEDFVAGSTARYGPRPIAPEEIVASAAEFDPQPMHVDEEAARATMAGELIGCWTGASPARSRAVRWSPGRVS